MNNAIKRSLSKIRKKKGIRKKINGSSTIPRVTITRTLKHIYAQAIDDNLSHTIDSFSSTSKEGEKNIQGSNKLVAKYVGETLGERLLKKGIKKIVFDRNSYLYHGKVKEIAEGLRLSGIQF